MTKRDYDFRQLPQAMPSAARCPSRWLLRANGAISAGTFVLKNVTLNGVAQDISIAYNATNAQIQAAIEAHAEYATAGVPQIDSISWGPLLSRDVWIEWTKDIDPPVVDNTSLTGDAGCGVRSGGTL